ncbi:hypothetical protein QE392_002884 [Microbacterium proteolyticum]|nr:hypothetical protein [Microbacterium proteolyticum]
MLGLAHQIGRDEGGLGTVVGHDEDLRGARLRVRADAPGHSALGRGNEIVARSGDHVDRVEADLGDAVGECADRSGTTHGVDLRHAEQPCGGEDDGVHTSAERRLRRRRQRDLAHTCDLRRDDVHHDAGGIDGLAPGNVQTHAPHRLPPLGDAGTGTDLGHDGRGDLSGGCRSDARDGGVEGRADLGSEVADRLVEVVGRNPDGMVAHPVESRGLLAESILAAVGHIVDETCGRGEGLVARGIGARHRGEELGRREHAAAEIDRAEHGSRLPAASARPRAGRAASRRCTAGAEPARVVSSSTRCRDLGPLAIRLTMRTSRTTTRQGTWRGPCEPGASPAGV